MVIIIIKVVETVIVTVNIAMRRTRGVAKRRAKGALGSRDG